MSNKLSPAEQKYIDELWDSEVVNCLDALKEADEAVTTINEDMFNRILSVASEINTEGGDVNTLKRVLKNFESKYKKARSVRHMPGSYRSAKSVIVNAVSTGAAVYDAKGSHLGKTAIERNIKEAKKKESKPEHLLEKRFEQVDTILNKLYPFPLIDEGGTDVRGWCDRIENHLAEIRRTYGV